MVVRNSPLSSAELGKEKQSKSTRVSILTLASALTTDVDKVDTCPYPV